VYRWIGAYIRRYYQNHGKTIRIPVHLSDKQMRLNKQLEALSTEIGAVSDDNATVVEARELAASMTQSVSLNAHVGDDSELGDLVAFTDETLDDQMDCDILLSRIQEHVTERDYDILVKRFGLEGNAPHTLSELSEEFGLTRARIHQVENQVLTTIKHVVGV
jgi:DNA-directed RNA polymerase sigma subunit (sigma70/sigma32)